MIQTLAGMASLSLNRRCADLYLYEAQRRGSRGQVTRRGAVSSLPQSRVDCNGFYREALAISYMVAAAEPKVCGMAPSPQKVDAWPPLRARSERKTSRGR